MDVSDGTRESLIAVFEAHEALIDRLISENAKLRELIFDMLVDEERGSTEENTYYEHVRLANGLGIEVRSRWSALTGTRGARTTATR
jgi:hypothetical protein